MADRLEWVAQGNGWILRTAIGHGHYKGQHATIFPEKEGRWCAIVGHGENMKHRSFDDLVTAKREAMRVVRKRRLWL